jgi:hypothetical protein
MTRLEKLKAARDAAWVAYAAARDASIDSADILAYDASIDALNAWAAAQAAVDATYDAARADALDAALDGALDAYFAEVEKIHGDKGDAA